MSPDGAQVLYTIRYADVARNRYFTHLWLHPLGESEARQLTVGEVNDGSARWSPDGKNIAFIRAVQGTPQICILPVAGGEARTLTSLPQGRMGELRWSPDGKRVAFAFCPIHADWSREAYGRGKTAAHPSPHASSIILATNLTPKAFTTNGNISGSAMPRPARAGKSRTATTMMRRSHGGRADRPSPGLPIARPSPSPPIESKTPTGIISAMTSG